MKFITEITDKFEGSITLKIRANDDDIRRYLDGCLPLIQGVAGRSPELWEEIKSKVVKAVRGMYVASYT